MTVGAGLPLSSGFAGKNHDSTAPPCSIGSEMASAFFGLAACGCARSLVALRLRTIREKLPWRPQQLRELSAHVEAMQDAVSDSRARRIYRKSALCGDEDGDGGID